MKKLFLSLLLMYTLVTPVTSFAAEKHELFDITSPAKATPIVSPGDKWSYDFGITNKTNGTVKVKLASIENKADKEFYDTLLISINGSDFKKLESASTDWEKVGKKDDFTYKVELYYPPINGNELMGRDFKADLHFTCEAPEGSINNGNEIIKTGDESNVGSLIFLLLVSGGISVILVRQVRKK